MSCSEPVHQLMQKEERRTVAHTHTHIHTHAYTQHVTQRLRLRPRLTTNAARDPSLHCYCRSNTSSVVRWRASRGRHTLLVQKQQQLLDAQLCAAGEAASPPMLFFWTARASGRRSRLTSPLSSVELPTLCASRRQSTGVFTLLARVSACGGACGWDRYVAAVMSLRPAAVAPERTVQQRSTREAARGW